MSRRRLVLPVIFVALLLSDARAQTPEHLARLSLEHIRILAADSLQGRETGTQGNRMAMEYIEKQFHAAGLSPTGSGFRHPFVFTAGGEKMHATNLIGMIKGKRPNAGVIVISAHFDHIGVRNGAIHNGADDNASGVAGLLAAAHWFRKHPPNNTLIFAAFDAEEKDLRGALAFLKNPPVPRSRIKLNINLDMISRSSKGELYASGTAHYPWLKPVIAAVPRPDSLHVLFGHDTPEHGAHNDWTLASDHGVFHQAGIPFIYFGVEDHEDYHKPGDDFSKIDRRFFIDATAFIIRAIQALDQHLTPNPRELR